MIWKLYSLLFGRVGTTFPKCNGVALNLNSPGGSCGVIGWWHKAAALRQAPNLPHCWEGGLWGDWQGFLWQKSIVCPRNPPVALYVGTSTNIMTFGPGRIVTVPSTSSHWWLCWMYVLFDHVLDVGERGGEGRGYFKPRNRNWGMFQQGCHTNTPTTLWLPPGNFEFKATPIPPSTVSRFSKMWDVCMWICMFFLIFFGGNCLHIHMSIYIISVPEDCNCTVCAHVSICKIWKKLWSHNSSQP
jgi:hypothetical protein